MTDPQPIELLDGFAFRKLAEQEPDGWLLDHIFPRAGPCLLVGRPTAGKSRFLSALTLAVGSGKPLAGRSVERGLVAWIYLEHMRQTLTRGLDAAAAGLEIARWEPLVRFVHVPDDAWVPTDDVLARTIKAIDAAGISLVIVDSLRRASSHRENASEEVAGTMRWLAAMSSGNRRTVIGIHHTTKDGRSVRGSDEFEAACDSTVFLSRARDDDTVPTEVFARHHGAAPVEWTLRVEHTDHLLRYADSAGDRATQGVTARQTAILRFVEETPHISPTQVAKAIKGKTQAVYDDIHALVADGRLCLETRDGAKALSIAGPLNGTSLTSRTSL